ncbi:DnaK-like suppressor protein [Pseudofrankia sp. EUN1h]|nr:DnaK-like suppressor protein [Pseudofrankia sp. EUN1h]
MSSGLSTPGPSTSGSAAFERLVVERARVAERLKALRLEFARFLEDSADVGADDEHDIEGASMPFEREQLRATLRQAAGEAEEIDVAFARLAAGTYGTCTVCGQPVGAGRLEARPAARTCVRCA